MDFAFELNGRPVFLPAEYQWTSSLDKAVYPTEYAIMGTGAKFGNNYMIADGFNEHGLAAAELYFSHAAEYDKEPTDGAINVVAEEFLLWALGNNKSIKELADNLKNVHIVESDKGVMGVNQPLHFIFSDETGATYIIEPEGQGLHLQEDKVGVMTNTPDYNWHKTNLSNYLGAQTTSKQKQLVMRKFLLWVKMVHSAYQVDILRSISLSEQLLIVIQLRNLKIVPKQLILSCAH